MRKKSISALDDFRLIAAVLVIAIHTSPLASVSAIGDFWLTRVLARIAVPFFFMVTGKFLKRNNVHFLRKILLLYAVSVFLYFPLNLYAGNWSIGGFLQDLLFRGTFYHLWYFPAIVLGVLIVWALGHLERKMAFVIASILYLIGLGGDSYYGLIQQVPFLKAFYEGVFSVFGYSRNGLFFAPLFLLLGTVRIPLGGKKCFWGFTVTLAAMSAEALWLHKMGVQRHDSMYLFLPLCAVFLFSGLLAYNGASSQKARKVSMFVYILHPWCIVVVRGIAKICGQQAFLVENSLLHFGAVVFVSFTGAWLLMRLRPIPQPQNIRAWREINCTALVQNVHVLQTQAHTPVMAVVKADGYGHGASLVAHVLQRAGVRGWSVASLSEGIALRRSGIRGRILILGYTHPSQAALLSRWNLTQTLVDEVYAKSLSCSGWSVRAHLAVDTGMHRLGVPCGDIQAISRIFSMPGLRVEGVFSHLCVADGLSVQERSYTEKQTNNFFAMVRQLRQRGIDPGEIHLYASYGVLNQTAIPCTWIRAGIALYGVYSEYGKTANRVPLRPVLSLRARVASVRVLMPGECAGYGLVFEAKRHTLLATVTIGYADGLPRMLPQSGGRVIVRGHYAPMVGRLCMDQMLVDVTDVPDVCAGDVVTLIGKDGEKEIRVEELAARCHTISNELLSGLSPRLGLVAEKNRHKIWKRLL